MQYLAQDLMLLALNPQTGKIRSAASSALRYSLMGAVLLDLVLQDKLMIENNHLIAANTTTTGDEFLDQCLNEVLAAPRIRTVKFWVNHWSRKYSRFRTVVLQIKAIAQGEQIGKAVSETIASAQAAMAAVNAAIAVSASSSSSHQS